MRVSYHPDPVEASKSWRYSKGFITKEVHNYFELSQVILNHVWSPILWMDGRRKQDNFLSSDFMVLDFDDGETTLAQALEIWSDTNHIIGSTKSHQVEKNGIVCDRFRVILKLEKPATRLVDYRYTISKLIDQNDCDPACKDGGRFFYPCTTIVSVCNTGFDEDLFVLQPHMERRMEETRKRERIDYLEHGDIPGWIEGALVKGVPKGSRNNKTYGITRALLDLGMAQANILDLILSSKLISASFTSKEATSVVESAGNGHRRSQDTNKF